MIEELCHKLKNKRKELGYSIEHIVNKTKLSPSVIKNIEEVNLDSIGGAYLKGFIKIYASFLKVQIEEDLEEMFSNDTPKQDKKQLKIKNKETKPKGPNVFDRIKVIPVQVKKKIFITLISFISILVVFNLGKVVFTKVSQIFKKRPPKVGSKIETPDIGPERENVKDEKLVKQVAPVKIKDVLGEMEVSLTAKKRCFLKVIVDGKLLFQGTLNKGAVETWKGTKEIEFKIKDGSAVYLEVNGKAIPNLTSIRKPIKSLKITPSGITVDK